MTPDNTWKGNQPESASVSGVRGCVDSADDQNAKEQKPNFWRTNLDYSK
jgi:hypothetical protein